MRAQLQGLGPVGQAVDRLPPSAPEGDGIFFWQSCPKFMQVLVNVGLHRSTRSTSTSTASMTLVVC